MSISVAKLRPEQVSGAKCAYTTRRVDFSLAKTLVKGRPTIRSGHLLLARVRRLGHHQRLELTAGRRARLFTGDTVALAYGNL